MNRKNLHSKYSYLGIPLNSNTFVSSVQSTVCFNRYQDSKYKDICSQDVCWEAFIYPISSYYEGVDKDQVLVQVLLIIVILIGFLVFLRPWWYIIWSSLGLSDHRLGTVILLMLWEPELIGRLESWRMSDKVKIRIKVVYRHRMVDGRNKRFPQNLTFTCGRTLLWMTVRIRQW